MRLRTVLLLTALFAAAWPGRPFAMPPGPGFAYDRIEEEVFTPTNADAVRAFIGNAAGETDRFRNALAYYRLGNMASNVEPVRSGIREMETLLSNGTTNAHILAYYAILFSGVTMFSPNIFEKLPALNRSFETLDRAVELYPDHFLPRFFRATLKLMVPGIFGGNESAGREDMDWVIARMDEIRRRDNFKAMIYLFYAVYWGDRRRDYGRALDYLAAAKRHAETADMKGAIETNTRKYSGKRG